MEQVTATGLPARVLARSSGERFLTDLLHVGRLLNAAATEEALGTASLVVWLRRRIREGSDRGDEEMSLRLESDAEAVQVLTIHRSKGLEFPVVYYPYPWDGYIFQERVDVPVFHDPDYGYEMTVDVGGERGRVLRPQEAPTRRAEGRGSPASLRRSHPRQAPGRPLVGPDERGR